MANTAGVIADIDLDHVAVALERWDDGFPRYAGQLGGAWLGGGESVGFASCQLRFANGMKVELLAPANVERNDFLRRHLDRNGPGPHHLTFKVKDIRAALRTVEEAGYHPVGVDLSDPGWQEAFLHPKEIPGVVVQLAQPGDDEWVTPAPSGLPEAEGAQAALVRVTHAVADLDEGLRLFRDLLAGQELGGGDDDLGCYVDLGWNGPGRVRLVTPPPGAGADHPLVEWLGGRRGRVHHLAFSGVELGGREVPPEDNLGTRLVTIAT